MHTPPVAQHLWLRRFVGTWTFEAEFIMGPDQPPITSRGTETVRMIGDLWIVAESTAEMGGAGLMNAVLSLGYDPSKGKFVGTWIGSPSATMFVYEGDMTDAGGIQTLPLNTIGPSWTDPAKPAHYQDILELRGDNLRTLSSQLLQDDKTWSRFMTATYRRVTG